MTSHVAGSSRPWRAGSAEPSRAAQQGPLRSPAADRRLRCPLPRHRPPRKAAGTSACRARTCPLPQSPLDDGCTLCMVVFLDSIKKDATDFLTTKRVVVTGVLKETKGHGSNIGTHP